MSNELKAMSMKYFALIAHRSLLISILSPSEPQLSLIL